MLRPAQWCAGSPFGVILQVVTKAISIEIPTMARAIGSHCSSTASVSCAASAARMMS